MKKDRYRRYVTEWNRPIGSIRMVARRLARLGLYVEVLAHKTSLVIERPMSMTWRVFLRALKSVFDPKKGSFLLFSEVTGNSFICSNRGNNPNRVVRI